jgi:hypothetical protein
MPRFPRLRPAGSGKTPVLLAFPHPNRVLIHERPESADRVEQRAMDMWPRLDQRALRRCQGDPARIAVQVARRTKMRPKAIERLISDR